jgi:hypothetical protein
MSGAKILAVLDKDGMRDAQGINGGETSPLEANHQRRYV